MKNLFTGACFALLVASVALNLAQYHGVLTSPKNLTFVINQPSNDPIVQAYETFKAER